MYKPTQNELAEILTAHSAWLANPRCGKRANLSDADLFRTQLSDANLSDANLSDANLSDANLSGADLSRANLSGAQLSGANLSGANLFHTQLSRAWLSGADLFHAQLSDADLSDADLSDAQLSGANLSRAWLSGANLSGVEGLVKILGVEGGNFYWKRIGKNMTNKEYKFKPGLNKLNCGEGFASDARDLCAYPGFHFASKSWCNLKYADRQYLCKIRIPEDAQINEPWATDGKASADKIEIVQIFDMFDNEKDVTDKFS